MKLYIAIPAVLVALLVAASGVAAVTRGWVLPTNRRPVRRPRLYGWGQLVAASALCWQMVFFWGISGIGIRQWGTLSGSALLLTGLILMMMSRRTGGDRQGSGAP
ncbi:hypothetical protein [Streptomyces atratus]|uniref:hypothetical protein n=1 Tax=Streptomyces atratus TaxID=1893 RepID=UPI0033C28842